MKLQKPMPLSSIYEREGDFSADLAETLDALNVGKFEDPETEASVGTRKADIVAIGEDGVLVVENQFNKADWDHWGRLEAYARLKKAKVAALVAESFEDLMITTCNLRNEDSAIGWYLIQAQANVHEELSFHQVVRPAIDIQAERQTDLEYKEFWAPILQGELGKLFAGKPEYVHNYGWLRKTIRNDIDMWLRCTSRHCYIQLYFQSPEHRDKIMALFPKSEYDYENTDNSAEIRVKYPVLDKGKKDRNAWPEIREKLVAMGTEIYNKINESDT